MNMSRSLDHLIAPPPSPSDQPIDLFFHMREGGEVTASTYLLRNSLFSRCFVSYWRSLAPSDDLQPSTHWIPTPNHDNGDLVVAIMNLINSSALLDCSRHILPQFGSDYYDSGQLLCFRLFRGALAQMSRHVPNLKIFFIRESFFRMHLGHVSSSSLSSLSSPSPSSSLPVVYHRKDIACHANDIIAHGWKLIGTTFWNHSHSSCNLAKAHEGEGGNTVCHWLTAEEERDIVIKKCFWRSPLCSGDREGSGSSHNLCLESSFCDNEKVNLQRWDLCVTHGHCNPSLTIRQIKKLSQSLPSPLQQPWREDARD
jgi:hypothetical protein